MFREKNTLLKILNHDLRESIRNIVSYSQLIEQSVGKKQLIGDVQQYRQHLTRNVSKLETLLRKIAD